MSNPVITYHGVQIYLAESDYPGCKEIVIVAAARGGPVKMFPGIVLDVKDMAELSTMLRDEVAIESSKVSAFRAGSFEAWKDKVVRDACSRNDVDVKEIWSRPKKPAVRRAKAQAVRVLVGFMSYGEAGAAVGLADHSSVHYWVKGAGKDKYK